MKNILIIIILLFTIPVLGTNYYIKNTGNDELTGLSDDQAWKTIAKVNSITFQPGDSILFRCGDEWREQLLPDSDGTAGNYIVYSSYGSGDKPLFSGTIRYTGWKVYSENIYYVTGVYSSGYFCIINNSIWGTGLAWNVKPDANYEYSAAIWNYAGGGTDDTIFIYLTTASDTTDLLFSQFGNTVYSADTDYQKFNGLRFSRGGTTSAYFIGGNYLEVNNCLIDSSGAGGIYIQGYSHYYMAYNDFQYNGSDGLYCENEANYGEVYRNDFRFNGIGNAGDKQAIGVWISHDIKFHYNYIFHTTGTVFEMSSHYGDYHQTNIEIANNTVIGASITTTLLNLMFGEFTVHDNILRVTKYSLNTTCLYSGEFETTPTKVYFYRNTVIGPAIGVRLALTGEVTGNSYYEIRNNIFYLVNTKYFDAHFLSADALMPYVHMDYNVYCSDVGTLFKNEATNCNFATWQTLSGQDAHSKALPVGWSGKVDFNTVYK